MKAIDNIIKKFPNWTNFNNNLNRDYDYLVLGDSEAYWLMNNMVIDPATVLNLSVPNQNVYMNWQVLRHASSIVKSDGTVFLLLSNNEICTPFETKPLPLHRLVLRKWFFQNTKWSNLKMRYPLIFQPFWTLQCYGVKIRKRKNQNISKETLRLISEMNAYCKERDLNFTLVKTDLFNLEINDISVVDYKDFIIKLNKQ